ncbi:hypothetical protein F511_21193 [Dorcoceras hygrometricum]|uniref:Uncharacterized protein n=1 Tax=Dorcoceras hygrometricum TaxID=472368 RepID=A0A2Z7B1W0_9LAMI|nr:hypothetical protein F511_21193 [Dorcoceras hygrometricum]
MPPRRRGRVVRQVVGDSRAPESDENVAQQSVPLHRQAGQAEAVRVDAQLANLWRVGL